MTTRAVFAVSLCAALGACALPAPNAIPEGVALSQSRLVVEMSNGARCTARIALVDGAAQGQMDRCPTPMTYAITATQATNPLRFIATAGEEGQGLSPLLRPNAFVTLTKDNGKSFRFYALDYDPAADSR